MKILLLSVSDNRHSYPECICDYLRDQIFIGLKELGHEVISLPDLPHLFQKNYNEEYRLKLYGKGFSYAFILDNYKLYNNIMIDNLLNNNEIDLCIVYRHHILHNDYNKQIEVIKLLQEKFSNQQIIYIDGHDSTTIVPIPQNILYLKRELNSEPTKYLQSISFSIPESKILDIDYKEIQNIKKRDFATIVPVMQNLDSEYMKTYIYTNENNYYNMMKESWFSLTTTKAGDDCMRHYEIISSGSLPLFLDSFKIKKYTMYNWPKYLFEQIKQLKGIYLNLKDGSITNNLNLDNCACLNMNNPGFINFEEFSVSEYINLLKEFREWLIKYGTSKSLAQYVLDLNKQAR